MSNDDGDITGMPGLMPESGWDLVPSYRGYANLGTGQYFINHSAAGSDPELVISIAPPEARIGRVVGDDVDNEPGSLIQPEDMCVRIRFENEAGLAALEKQLAWVRKVHFS